MKHLIAFALLILSAGPLAAQQPVVETAPAATTSAAEVTSAAATPASVPDHAYCEIIGDHMPSYTGDGVIFDFGQKTDAWAYNWLRNGDGQKIVFNSNIEALNYMVRRGWEFVAVFSAGEKNQSTHYLLRIGTSRLTEAQRQQLLEEPRAKNK